MLAKLKITTCARISPSD